MNIKEELNNFPSDGTKLEEIEKEEEEKETPAEATTEKEPEEKEEEQEEEKEEEVPFHKHPRFKELVEEKNQYKAELDKLREDTESKFSELKESQSKTETVPSWFSELYGDNETAWAKYQEQDKNTREEIKREIKEELANEREKEKNSIKKWELKIEEQLKELEDEGEKFDRNELTKFMEEKPIYDQNGNLDFKEKLELLRLKKVKDPAKSKARKEIADDGVKSKSEPENKGWKTPEDMKGVGWDGMS